MDVLAKVTGRAKYSDDLKFERMLHVKVVRSPHPHARILGINSQKALEIPGVVAVYTAKDIPGIPGQPKERPVLAPEVVRYAGDGVALVAAETEQAAIAGAAAVEVLYQELPAVFDPEEALQPGAPVLHADSNLVCHHKVRKGDVKQGFREADIVLERELSTHRVQHVAIEPEAAVALPTLEGVTVYCPSKSPFNVRRVVAETLGITQSQVRLIQPAIGGSFGGKDYDMSVMASRAALAAKLSGRPCKMVYSREESIIEGTKRQPYKMKYKVGAKKDGRLTAMEITIIGDAGAYLSKSAMIAWRSAVEAAGPYVVPHVKTDVICAYTNNVYSDALRGFGSPQVDFASETVMDVLADELGLDPLELRRLNGLKSGSVSATGQVMEAVSLHECLDKLEEALDWKKRRVEIKEENKGTGKVKGLGLACIHRGESLGAGGEGIDTAGVTVQVQRDGSVTLYSGLSEVGQGGHTMLARVVSEILGINPQRIVVSPVDTAYVPDSGPTVASRGTVLAGNAARLAAEEVKGKLAGIAAKALGVEPEELTFADEKVFVRNDPAKMLPYEKVVALCYAKSQNAYGHGWWSAPELWWDHDKGCGKPYFSYTYGACGAEVEIDLATGKVDVLKFVAVHDVGNAMNREEVKGQIGGGVAMGIGFALMEDVKLRQGVIENTNLDEYLIPTSLDIHDIVPVIVEHPGLHGPLGARGLGEPATSIVAPAILNAIAHALGRRIYHLPADLEKVMAEIGQRKSDGFGKGAE